MIDTKLKNFIINTLRKASYRHKPRGDAEREARIAPATYVCAHCGCWIYTGTKTLLKANIEVPEGITIIKGKHKIDHILPVVPIEGFQGFDVFIERLFCEKESFQILCTDCHDIKTKEENKSRREYKTLNKQSK